MAPKPSEPRSDRPVRVPAWLILIIPPLCWAGNFVIGRAMHAEIPPGAFTFWRWVVAAAVLVPFAAADAWRHRRVLARHWTLIGMLAASGVVAFQYFVYRGLQTTTAINGVLIMSTIPVAIPIVALLLDGTLISRRQALGIAVSLTGVATIILRGDVGVVAGLQFAPGDLWIFLSVPAWALYSVIVKRAPADPPPLALLFATVLFGLAILAPGYALEVATRGGFAVSWSTLASLVYVGAFASVVAFACWNSGVARVGAARAGLFIHLMPVFAAILAMLFLGETMHWYHVTGIAGIAGGIWLSSTGRG